MYVKSLCFWEGREKRVLPIFTISQQLYFCFYLGTSRLLRGRERMVLQERETVWTGERDRIWWSMPFWARSGSGPGSGRCFPVFPKGPAPAAQRGVWHPSGLQPSAPRVVFAPLRGPPIGGQGNDRVSNRHFTLYTLSRFAGLRPGGKHVTGFSGRFALLQIQFLCHLKGKRENRWH